MLLLHPTPGSLPDAPGRQILSLQQQKQVDVVAAYPLVLEVHFQGLLQEGQLSREEGS